MNKATITYFGQKAKVACDCRCNKAWGMDNRPRIQLSDDEDDWAYLADPELGEAPIDPGTFEGWHRKPLSPDEFPNRWCVRQCERCVMSEIDRYDKPLALWNFDKRFYNLLRRYKMDEFNQITTDTENECANRGVIKPIPAGRIEHYGDICVNTKGRNRVALEVNSHYGYVFEYFTTEDVKRLITQLVDWIVAHRRETDYVAHSHESRVGEAEMMTWTWICPRCGCGSPRKPRTCRLCGWNDEKRHNILSRLLQWWGRTK